MAIMFSSSPAPITHRRSAILDPMQLLTLLPNIALGALLFSLSSIVSVAQEMAHQPDTTGFAGVVQPFVKAHCVNCHGPEKQKGKLRLDTLGLNFGDPLVAEKWKEVVNSIHAHEMPPEEEPRPDPDAAGRFADWLTAELGRAEVAKRATRVVLRRMNRAEYDNTIRDLIGVDFKPSQKFPEDPPAGGFDNIGQALTISPLQMELYYSAARQILDRALVEGDQPKSIKWRFETEDDKEGGDRTRLKRDEQNVLLNRGENPIENGFTAIHHEAWNTGIERSWIHASIEGNYILRFRAAGRVPTRAQGRRVGTGNPAEEPRRGR
jgi:hypothetical protein